MKCLPLNKIPLCRGAVLHDWHAEVLAIRAFNRFLLDQCLLVLRDPCKPSPYIRPRSDQERTPAEAHPFTIREDVKIFMYCSEAPCGDASMELVMDRQDDATPWTSPEPTISTIASSTDNASEQPPFILRGRSHFSHLGSVRCKPSRPDAPPTLSKSCTDKIAHTQATSVLSSLPSLLLSPKNAYLHSLILPHSQLVPSACERAFSLSGRLHCLSPETTKKWIGGYVWHGLQVHGTQRDFSWSRRMVGSGEKAVPSNLSAVWTPAWQETLIGGVLQGRKQFDLRGASAVCRLSLWKTAMQVAGLAGVPALVEALGKSTYEEVKGGELLAARKQVKKDVRMQGLSGWVRNIGDDIFTLESS